MKKRVFIIYTGGTLGMKRSPNGYVAVQGLQQLIDEKIPPRLAVDMPEYDLWEFPEPIDSSNIFPRDWLMLTESIAERYDDYDGFVVIHGTDTMAYTTSALSFMLRGLTKPVVVTGSQIPLSELRNDAQANLVTAIELASSYPIPEVCLYFSGKLLRGNRTSKLRATGFDAFDTPNYPPLAEVGIDIDVNDSALLTMPEKTAFELPKNMDACVRILSLYPGMQADMVDALSAAPCRALILRTYGVGNGPSSDKKLLNALLRAHQRGILLANVSQCWFGMVSENSYETGSALAHVGLVSAGDMTVEAAFCKLHHLCAVGLSGGELKSAFIQNLCGELTAY